MPAPTTREELESTNWFKWGLEARKKREPVAKGLRMLRPASWQYDAYIAGYDSHVPKPRARG